MLALEKPESSVLAEQTVTAEGITVVTGAAARQVRAGGDGVAVTLADGNEYRAERLLVATGRRADLNRLGVDSVGLDPAGRAVTVDERMRAGQMLWAVGDVVGRGAFTHVAMYQAGIGAVGLTEAQAGPTA